jgi:hypothetical protein
MENLRNMIRREIFSLLNKKDNDDCGCGCDDCNKNLITLRSPSMISEHLQYHISNKLGFNESILRPGSKAHMELAVEIRNLINKKAIILEGLDHEMFESTDLGRIGIYEGQKVLLDYPLLEELDEAEFKGKEVQIGKPKRGGSKKFYVYVKDPRTKRIKKVSFGDTTGLRAKLNNPKARQAFAKRHNCANKKDRTKASYWSCRLPRYAKLLGFKTTFSGYW